MALAAHHEIPGGEVRDAVPVNDAAYAVPLPDSAYAGSQDVADSRTPLTVLLLGEDHERAQSNRAIEAGVDRIVEAIVEAIEMDDESLREIVREAIGDEIQRTRLNTVRGMLRYFWHGGLNPWEAMKKLLAATREAACHLIGGVSQTEVAALLGETKAATSAREKQLEELLKRWGVRGFRLVGGGKTDEAREIYRQVQKGNKSRRKGQRRKRAEELRRGTGSDFSGT